MKNLIHASPFLIRNKTKSIDVGLREQLTGISVIWKVWDLNYAQKRFYRHSD